MEESKETKQPDRPLECSECQRPIQVVYTEVVGKQVTRVAMCQDCPVLRNRLRGKEVESSKKVCEKESATGLCCGSCGTDLDSVRTGHPLGCAHCYEIFGDVLFKGLEVVQAEGEQEKTVSSKSGGSALLHVGRAPGEMTEINPSVRLIALNEALNETLRKEDYEQAAWLRDQIKAIKEETDGTSDKQD